MTSSTSSCLFRALSGSCSRPGPLVPKENNHNNPPTPCFDVPKQPYRFKIHHDAVLWTEDHQVKKRRCSLSQDTQRQILISTGQINLQCICEIYNVCLRAVVHIGGVRTSQKHQTMQQWGKK
jgi:hypothetical protein